MIQARRVSLTEVKIDYSAAIDAFGFTAADFVSSPSDLHADFRFEIEPRQLGLVFPDDVTADATITYSGSLPGITHPQTIAYT
jgi:hypothetical protein